MRFSQASRFGVRARARRLVRRLFCLHPCLRELARATLRRGKLHGACFGLALGRELRLERRLGVLLRLQTLRGGLIRKPRLLNPPRDFLERNLLQGKALPCLCLGFVLRRAPLLLLDLGSLLGQNLPLDLRRGLRVGVRATFRSLGQRRLRHLALLRQRRRLPADARIRLCRRCGPAFRRGSRLALQEPLRFLLRTNAGGAFGLRLRLRPQRRGLGGLRFGQRARLRAGLQLRLGFKPFARRLRLRLVCCRTRLRRLVRCSLCLYSCLRKLMRTAFGSGEFSREFFSLAFGGELRLGRRLGFRFRQQAARRRVIGARRFSAPARNLFQRDLLQDCAMPRRLLGFDFGFAALLLLRLGCLFRLDPRFDLRRGLRVRLRPLLRRAQRFGLAVCALLLRCTQRALRRLAPPGLVQRRLLKLRFLVRGDCSIARERLAVFRFGFVLRQQSFGAGGLRQCAHFIRRKRILCLALLVHFSQPPLDLGPIPLVFGRTCLRRDFLALWSAGWDRRLVFVR